MKITQPSSMAVRLQMNSQHMYIEYSFGGGGKLPNANCHQTTKWKIFEIESGRPFFYGLPENVF